MARRKKPDAAASPAEDTPEEAADALRLRFRGEVIELVSTAEYPFQVLQTEEYETWADSISDIRTSTRIDVNVDKMQRGLFGDWKIVGDGVFEMRLDFGAGYRIYYARHGAFVVVLLAGGDKSDQRKAIADAKRLWKGMKNEITQV